MKADDIKEAQKRFVFNEKEISERKKETDPKGYAILAFEQVSIPGNIKPRCFADYPFPGCVKGSGTEDQFGYGLD